MEKEIERKILQEARWEVKLIRYSEFHDELYSKESLASQVEWLLGGLDFQWNVERTAEGLLLMRK